PEPGRRALQRHANQQKQRRCHEHQQHRSQVAVATEPPDVKGGEQQQGKAKREIPRARLHCASRLAISATRRPSTRARWASSSLGCGSSWAPATWLAPYGVPPVVVWLSAGSVNGMPTIRQPWCNSGICIDSSVDSWPPCIEAVEVNTAAGLPTRVPFTHSAPRPSRKCLTGAAMLPKRVGLPSTMPSHSARSLISTYGAPSSGT